MSSDNTKVDASTTAVESLLRTLDEAATWDGRAASRVRAFARPARQSGRLSVVADEATIYDELRARHERRAV
jgi:hypothetical protein